MTRRHPTNPEKDSRIFTRTARTVKAINLPATIFRGGIRL